MPKTTRLPPKKDVALALLEHSTVFVHLDPRKEEVRVPPWFRKQPQLVLQVGLNMPVPIPDLNLDEEGLSCTLSFNRSPHFCKVPWSAVYALVGESGRGMVWPEDVPAEVAAQAQPAQKADEKRGHLRAVAPESAKPAASAKAKPAKSQPAKAAAAPADAADGAKPNAGKAEKKRKRARRAETVAATRPAPQPQPLPQPAQAPAASDGDNGSAAADKPEKKKRELPPYLRVVK